MKKVYALIACDCPLIYNGLTQLMSKLDRVVIKGIVENGHDILSNPSISEISILLIDHDISGLPCMDAIIHLKSKFPSVRILVMLSKFDHYNVSKIKKLGADGCIPLKLPPLELKVEISHFIDFRRKKKEFYLPGKSVKTNKRSESAPTSKETVTEREKEIINLIASGRSSKEIAVQLSLSVYTVKVHRKNIFRKLQVTSQIDLVKQFWSLQATA